MRCSSASNARRIPHRRTLRAFTLLEAMVALLIATAGFAGVFMALVQSQRAQTRTAQAEVELVLARQLIEEACLGLLPPEQGALTEERGVQRWTGVRNGVPWVVTVRAVATRPAHDEPTTQARTRESEAYVLMEVVTAEVGAVSLRTVKW